MGFKYYKQPKLNISFRSDYRKAVFGLFHVAFLDNNNRFVLPIEDKESLSIALDFYHERILKRELYPVYDGSNFSLKPSHDREVLRQVLGLPFEIFDSIDSEQDILAQLRFLPELNTLKKECYVLLAQSNNTKWYRDDFKLYCLRHGFFFLNDETKPFVERQDASLPVFINEKLLTPKYKKLCDEAISSRLAIDFLGSKDDNQINYKMAKLDRYSFDRRLSFFVNDDQDTEIELEGFDLIFQRKYAFLLRQYFASIINVLYDDYCFEVLNKVAAKLSFLTVSKIHTDKDIYSLSSFHADMYSFDKEHFFFAESDKEKIERVFSKNLEENPAANILTLYACSGLPYEGYQYVKDIQDVQIQDIMTLLPFGDISTSEIYLSSKRYDAFYSYLSGEKEHRYAFLLRLLLDRNIDYECEKPILVDDKENKIKITIDKANRSRLLKAIFDSKKGSFVEAIYPSYLLDNKKLEDVELESILNQLDEKSFFQAMPFFYHHFDNYSLGKVIDLMLMTFDLQDLNKEKLYSFFSFALLYPLLVAEQEYRITALEEGNALSLMVLDGLPKQNESYEPNMPYPYVCYGSIAYSFRETYFSKAYICSCQKEAIAAKIEYLSRQYDRYHKEVDEPNKKAYIIAHLGLPGNVVFDIDLNKDLLSQIPFKDDLCHLCRHSAPSYHDNIDNNEEDSHNVYLTYIRSKAAENGVFFSQGVSMDYDYSTFFDQLSNKEYHTLIAFDRSRINPILLPYINVSKNMIISLLSSFFANEMTDSNFYSEVVRFLSLGETLIAKLMFDCDEKDYIYIYSHMMIFTRLVYLYKMIEMSYALYVSADITPPNENEFTLNIDYNPKRKHPYVLLGSRFNAYADNLFDGKYYLCECDRFAMKKFLTYFASIYDSKDLNSDIKVPVLLGILGLPYLVVLKYSSLTIEDGDVASLIDQMVFRHHICRRDLQVAHASYDEPFRLAYPFKENMQAEYNFSINQMMKDNFFVLSDYSLIDIHFRKNYHYDLDATFDYNLPYFIYYSDSIPEELFTFFVMSKDTLNHYLDDFGSLNSDIMEANAYARGVILDSFFKDEQVFLNFTFENGDMSLRKMVEKHFPEITRVRDVYYDMVIQQILGFMSYLYGQFFAKYAIRESYVGS